MKLSNLCFLITFSTCAVDSCLLLGFTFPTRGGGRGNNGGTTASRRTRNSGSMNRCSSPSFDNNACGTTGSNSSSSAQFCQQSNDNDNDYDDNEVESSRLDFLKWASENSVYMNIGDDSIKYNDNDDDDDEDISESEQHKSKLFWKTVDSVIGNNNNNNNNNARIVAISEGCHNSKEQMQWQELLVQHLVKHHNFTVVVSESGLPESKLISDYILQNDNYDHHGHDHDHDHDVEYIYRKGLNQMYSAWQEGRNLIEWMRKYNKKQIEGGNRPSTNHPSSPLSANKLLKYYGIDIGGFYHDWKFPIENNVLSYLQRHIYTPKDAFRIVNLKKRWDPYLDALKENARIYYTDIMTSEERNELSILLVDTFQVFIDLETELIKNSGKDEFEWAKQSIISMQFAEQYYRNYMDRRKTQFNNGCNEDVTTSFSNGLNGREIAMHQNILWVLKQNPSARIIWINHVVHTKTETQYQGDLWGWFTPTGAMLRQSIGKDKLCCIGLAYGSGKYWKDWQQGPKKRTMATIPPSKEFGLEQTLGSISLASATNANQNKNSRNSSTLCFIPWSKALLKPCATSTCNSSSNVSNYRPWLRSVSSLRENDYFLKVRPIEWDACVYIDKVDPATPI